MRSGALRLAGLTSAFSVVAFACVDLFHDTAFTTLCDVDASACARDAESDAGAPKAEAGARDLCLGNDARNVAAGVCARLGACLGTAGTARFGECSIEAQLAYDCAANPGLRPIGARAELWACLAGAKTCDAVQACVFPDGPQPCRITSGTIYRCGTTTRNATTVVGCSAGATVPVSVEPCLLTGRTCAAAPVSGDGTCSGGASSSCGSAGPRKCVGTVAMECSPDTTGANDTGIDCATVGAGSCVDTTTGPGCAPTQGTGATCLVEGATCNGKRATACVGETTASIDCAALDLDCMAPDGGTRPWNVAASCRAPAGRCDDAEPDQCAADSSGFLLSCRRGARITVDCVGAGLGKCRSPEGGTVNAACGAP